VQAHQHERSDLYVFTQLTRFVAAGAAAVAVAIGGVAIANSSSSSGASGTATATGVESHPVSPR